MPKPAENSLSTSLASVIQTRVASGAWRVVAIAGVSHMADVRAALEREFGPLSHGVIAVMEAKDADA